MSPRLTRGEIYRLAPAPEHDPKRSRCYVIVARQTLLDSRADKVICAPINSQYDGLMTQVPVGIAEGLKHDSCINCDQLILVDKSRFTNHVGALSTAKLRSLRQALRIALDIE